MNRNDFITFSFYFLVVGFVRAVEVEIDLVSVPKYYTPLNDDIYISGSWNSWVPNDVRYKFSRLAYNSFKIIIDLPIGTHQYKIVRGSWDTVETAVDGSPIANRVLQITTTTKQFLKLTIANWDDMKGKHTATGNTHMLDRKFPYPQFNTTKRIWIYLPPDYYTSSKTYPVIYMHDGQNLVDALYSFIGEWGVDETMESIALQGKTASIIVGIETSENRISELTPYSNPQYGGGKADYYLDFILNNLKPHIDSNFRTKSSREFTGIAGSSLGGLLSFYGGIKFQNVFSKIGIFSPSFWYSDKIYDFALNSPPRYNDVKLYFVCGSQESSTMVSDMSKMILDLQFKGYTNIKSLVQSDGQHSEWFWKREFTAAYEWLYLL